MKTRLRVSLLFVVGGLLGPFHPAARAQTLGEALNATNLDWMTSGNGLWFAETNVTHDGTSAAQTGTISNNQSSVLRTTVTGPGTLTFWWRIVSYPQAAHLAFKTNGTTLVSIWPSADSSWQSQTNYLGSGNQIIRWDWRNTSSSTNTAWLDQVAFAPGATAPIITLQPTNQFQASGLRVTFNVIAVGTPPLTYQWQFNGTNIPGATGASLVITNVQSGDYGEYAVIVSNLADVVTSSNMSLWRSQIGAWGNNYGGYGQNSVPIGLTNGLSVAAGEEHSMVLKNDGTVVAWGANYLGQTNVPVGLTNVIAIAAKRDGSLALKSDGSVVAWGDLPSIPLDLTDVVAIAAGGDNVLALKANGSVVGWGDPPVPSGLSNVVAITAGYNHCLAVKADGSVVAWGANDYGKATVPPTLSNVVAVAAGDYDSAALKADGTVSAWGGAYGGDNDPTNVPPGLSNVVAIASGGSFYAALRADGTIVMWGFAPSAAEHLTNVTAIACGDGFCLALVGDGPPMHHASYINPSFSSIGFVVSLPTQSGDVYRLEYTDSLTNPDWVALPLVAGNGRTLTLSDSTATNGATRFYRVRRW